MNGATMYKQAALDVLAFNEKTVESLVHLIPQTTNHIIMKDKDNIVWTFITRRRCHLYVLAKSPQMSHYEEIYKKA